MKTIINSHKSGFFIFLLALMLALASAFSLSQPVQAETIPCLVTSNADSGDGTLRAWLADTSCCTITFADSYDIHLASPLVIETDRAVMIDGAGYTVTITDDNYWRVFSVKTSADVTLQNLALIQSSSLWFWDDYSGTVAHGSLIQNFGNLKVNDSIVTGTSTSGSIVGGAIYNQGTLTITRSIFTGNSALGGGAIYNDGYTNASANVTVKDSTFAGNTSTAPSAASDYWTGIIGGGGAMVNFMGTLTVTGSTFTGNTPLLPLALQRSPTTPSTVTRQQRMEAQSSLIWVS